MSRFWKLSFAIIAVLAIAGAAVGFVSAQTDGEAETDQPDIDVIARLAANLGVTQEELEAAIQATQLEIVDELLANGTIDEDRAAEMRERIESGEANLFFGGPRGHHRPVAFALYEVAEQLDVTVRELVAAWEGQTLADTIVELGGNVDEVKAAVLAALETKLTEKGADPDRIAEVLENASAAFDRLLEHEGPPFPKGPGDFQPPFENGVPEDAPAGAGLTF